MNFDALTEKLDSMVDETAFSGVISIHFTTKLFMNAPTGFADRTHRVLNTLDTRFGIASGTKFFTALAIGQLIDTGQLEPSTRVNQVLDLPFKFYSPEITLQHLLTHTSGIPDYFDEEIIADFDNFTVAVPWNLLKGPRDYLQVFP